MWLALPAPDYEAEAKAAAARRVERPADGKSLDDFTVTGGGMEILSLQSLQPCTLYPLPYSLHPTPAIFTLRLASFTPHPFNLLTPHP